MKPGSLAGLISPFFNRVLRPAVRVARWLRREHIHELVFSHDGRSAFGLIGNDTWRLRFSRYCFGEKQLFRTKYSVHFSFQHVQVMAARYGLVVMAGKKLPDLNDFGFLKVPSWVAMCVDLRNSEEEFRSALPSSVLKDLRTVRAKKFTYEVHRDSDWAEEFYRLYHRPSIEGRHGGEGYVMPASEMAEMVRERGGEFVVVSQDGKPVGAMLNEVKGKNYYFRRIGWLHGDPVLRKSSLITAIYWYSMQRARQLGYRQIQFGGTPPCLEEGTFQFKTKWSATLDRAETVWEDYFLLINPAHPDMRGVLKNHSFLALNSQNEFIVLSGKAPCDVKLSAATAQSIARWYRLRDEPLNPGEVSGDDLPPHLRPWFGEESI